MSKIISADLVIGNFIINSLIHGYNLFKVSDLVDYDSKLSKKIADQDYFTKFNLNGLINFQINYPFILNGIDDPNRVEIQANIGQEQLVRYFQMGLPNYVVKNMTEAYNEILN